MEISLAEFVRKVQNIRKQGFLGNLFIDLYTQVENQEEPDEQLLRKRLVNDQLTEVITSNAKPYNNCIVDLWRSYGASYKRWQEDGGSAIKIDDNRFYINLSLEDPMFEENTPQIPASQHPQIQGSLGLGHTLGALEQLGTLMQQDSINPYKRTAERLDEENRELKTRIQKIEDDLSKAKEDLQTERYNSLLAKNDNSRKFDQTKAFEAVMNSPLTEKLVDKGLVDRGMDLAEKFTGGQGLGNLDNELQEIVKFITDGHRGSQPMKQLVLGMMREKELGPRLLGFSLGLLAKAKQDPTIIDTVYELIN